MRIAVISTPFACAPPDGYAGAASFCRQLADALLRRGHDVTLFATGDTAFSSALVACFPTATWPPSEAVERAHMRFCLYEVSRDRQGYDAVQINSSLGLPIARDLGIPVVHTLHHPRDERLSRIYAAHPEVHYVALSHRQLELETPLRYGAVIHPGVDLEASPPVEPGEEYVLYLGPFTRGEGTHLAIDAAVAAETRIVVAGRARDEEESRDYFDAEVEPRLNLPGVVLEEATDPSRSLALLANARALLRPIDEEEPTDLVAIEAMVSGTPVVGFGRGSLPEIVDQGVTGILVSDLREMALAIPRAARLDRSACAARARERFSAERMAAAYEGLFDSIQGRKSAPRLVAEQVSARQSRYIG